jgi:hypothetical protein
MAVPAKWDDHPENFKNFQKRLDKPKSRKYLKRRMLI